MSAWQGLVSLPTWPIPAAQSHRESLNTTSLDPEASHSPPAVGTIVIMFYR